MVAIAVVKEIRRRKYIFFSFPKTTNKEEEKRNKIWVNFYKRKGFVPPKYTGLCSLHFSEDAYVTSHSAQFLSSLNFQEKQKLFLKPDAVPTKNKPLNIVKDTSDECKQEKRRDTGALARRKVSNFQSMITMLFIRNFHYLQHYLFI